MSVKLFRQKDPQPLPDSGVGWVMRMRSGTLNAQERAGVARWLEAAPDHPRDLLRAEAAWRLAGVLEADECVQRDLEELDQLRAQSEAEGLHGQTAMWASFAAAAGMMAIGWVAWSWLTPSHYETKRGEQRMVTLADGSAIALNTDTRLIVDWSASARKIRLERGEALFDVAHNPQQPFIVRTRSGFTRALGTRFNVLAQEGGAVVSVLEGKVEVVAQEASEKRVLDTGQSVAYTAWGQLVKPEPTQASTERISAWREGKLRFESWPLDRAVREYNRYAQKPIELQVDREANIRISGVFRIGDSVAFVQALGELVGASVVDRGDVLLLQSPPSPKM